MGQDGAVAVIAPPEGQETGKLVAEYLEKHEVHAWLHQGTSDAAHAVARSKMAVVVLTKGTLQDEACVLAMHMADAEHYGLGEPRRVILLHDVSGLPRFPAYSQVCCPSPPSWFGDGRTLTIAVCV